MIDSLDILWIVLAFCALWFTAFLCWAIYHVAMVMRRVHLALDEARHVLVKIESAINGVKDKLDHHGKLIDAFANVATAAAGSALRTVKKQWDEKREEK
ncbi:hypothetical protein HQ524_01605 [Candidatus Uhrbacteria bacterium]|nr:hypothetical protein [Candidatus Uhrbacteria bacterium]